MGLWKEVFFSEDSIRRVFRDIPLIFFSTVAATSVQHILEVNASSKIPAIDTQYLFPIIGIALITALVIACLVLAYIFIGVVIRSLK